MTNSKPLSSPAVTFSQMSITQKASPSHSSLFDEVAIALPHHISSPILAIVAAKLQSHIFASVLSDNSNCAKYPASIYPVDTDSEQTATYRSDITQAKTLLSHLLQTPVADASVLVALTNEPKPKLLLTRRATHLNAHAGEVSFAGGKYDYDDGNNVVTALREACEETALPSSCVQIVGQLPTQTSKAGMSVRPIVAFIDPDVIYVPELGEIERIFWADFETLITQPMVDYEFAYQMGDNKEQFVTPSWIIDGETVWGLTGRVIASLLKICFGRDIKWYYRPKSTISTK